MMAEGGTVKKGAAEITKAVLVTLIFSLVAVLILAVLVRTSLLSDGAVKLVNQFVKVLAVFLGCYTSVRDGKGLLKGGIAGALGTLVTCLVFSLISGSLPTALALGLDELFGTAIGGVSGIVAVNLKKN